MGGRAHPRRSDTPWKALVRAHYDWERESDDSSRIDLQPRDHAA
ncbi:hypothetical protein GGR71_000343 [Xanthomonas sp. F1]